MVIPRRLLTDAERSSLLAFVELDGDYDDGAGGWPTYSVTSDEQGESYLCVRFTSDDEVGTGGTTTARWRLVYENGWSE